MSREVTPQSYLLTPPPISLTHTNNKDNKEKWEVTEDS